MEFAVNKFLKGIRGNIVVLIVGLIVAYLIAKADMILPVLMIVIAVAASALYMIAHDIKWGFYFLMLISFFSVGVTRYAPGLPLGLMVDFLLIFILLAFFLGRFRDIDWSPLKNPTFLAIGGWMIINLMEIVNPGSHSFEAWFYAMRGVSLYLFLTVMLGLMCLTMKDDFKWFVNIWFACSIIGTLWGLKQMTIGLDSAEKAWLAVPGNLSTHMLFGRLRVFSFYSDAGQFGASQAHTALVAVILAIREKATGRKIFYFGTGFLCVIGMLISGTRGAIAIPVIGFFTYLILIRNFRIVVAGVVVFAILFGLLQFTHVGQGIYQINRLRTALNPNDASFQVRLENQKKLRTYLNGHPFGGGIGSAGYWGQRFSPNTFLANLALDSWYVRIAAEFGYVGLVLYIIVLLVIVFRCLKTIHYADDPDDRNHLIAIFCGLSGILVASYTNQVFGQMPTGTIIYMSIAFLAKDVNPIKHAAA